MTQMVGFIKDAHPDTDVYTVDLYDDFVSTYLIPCDCVVSILLLLSAARHMSTMRHTISLSIIMLVHFATCICLASFPGFPSSFPSLAVRELQATESWKGSLGTRLVSVYGVGHISGMQFSRS